jgi:4-amino-4-deoxy-L-arabinose transferase-like glycosyltransferase
MTSQKDQLLAFWAWVWIIGFTVFRCVYATSFQLTPDETNYWQWSRYLALGYYDQAPMIAWAIRLATHFFGQNEFAVRLPSILAMAVASGYLVAIANRWASPRTALAVAVLSQGILEFNVGGLLATCDGLQAAAWAAAAYHVARGYESDTWSQWLFGGFWFGAGMLSKYTMVIFLPCVFFYGLLSPTHRRCLASLKPWIAVGLGAAMFWPVVAWNAQNHWSSLRHVAYIGGVNEGFTLHFQYLGDYIASQAALLSPIVFILMLWAWALAAEKAYRSSHWLDTYLFFTSFPMIAGFGLLSLHTRVYGNWPGAGYLTGAVLVATMFSGRSKAIFREKPYWGQRLWPWAVGTSYLITALVLLQVVWPVLPLPVRLDRTATELTGWRELGLEAKKMQGEMPRPDETFLFALRYQIASELAFYTPGQPKTVSINRWFRPNVYDFWWNDADLLGKDGIVVTEHPGQEKQLAEVFDRVEAPVRMDVFRPRPFSKGNPEPVKHFWLYRAHNFKGGIHWVPPNHFDIRAD